MHVFCFYHTWFIYNLNTIFIRCKHTRAIVYIIIQHFHEYCSFDQPPLLLPSLPILTPCMSKPPLFYLLGDPSFGDRYANIHPLSSLVSHQLCTPCFLTLAGDTPCFMLHVYIDDITTSATLSDTVLSYCNINSASTI
jgi:hypothetical protein